MSSYPALNPDFDPSLKQETQFWHNVSSPKEAFIHSLDSLMLHAIDAATLSSSLQAVFPNGRRGGPFGVAGAIPWEINLDGKRQLFRDWYPTLKEPSKVTLDETSVFSWRVVVRAANLVEVLDDYTAHAEGIFARYVGEVCGGRNLWKRFVAIASTGAPCGMCAQAIGAWGCPRIFLSGASIAQAILAGFHEARSELELENIRSASEHSSADDDSWAIAFRAKGIVVRTGLMETEVIEKLYKPYLNSGGTLYNSGPNDPSG